MKPHDPARRRKRRLGLALGIVAAAVIVAVLLSPSVQNRVRFAWRFAKIGGDRFVALYRERDTSSEWWLIHPEAFSDAEKTVAFGDFVNAGDRVRRYVKRHGRPLLVRADEFHPLTMTSGLFGGYTSPFRVNASSIRLHHRSGTTNSTLLASALGDVGRLRLAHGQLWEPQVSLERANRGSIEDRLGVTIRRVPAPDGREALEVSDTPRSRGAPHSETFLPPGINSSAQTTS